MSRFLVMSLNFVTYPDSTRGRFSKHALHLRPKKLMRHEKTDLKVLAIVIPKRRIGSWVPTDPSLGMTPTIEHYYTVIIDYIL